jgi:hypothetical protein
LDKKEPKKLLRHSVTNEAGCVAARRNSSTRGSKPAGLLANQPEMTDFPNFTKSKKVLWQESAAQADRWVMRRLFQSDQLCFRVRR